MIRINLLPPELRKRQGTGVNREFVGFVAGLIAAGLVVGFWAWISYVRIPHAKSLLKTAQNELAVVKVEADEVRQLKGQVVAAENRLKKLEDLIVGKVRWASAINDFATLLADDKWSVPGFQVACRSLTIGEHKSRSGGRRGAASKQTAKQFSFRWELLLVGQEFERAGDYVSAFFEDVKVSDWWRHYGFVGEPVEPYRGDTPQYNEKIERVSVTHSLEWVRDQGLQAENRAVAAERDADSKSELGVGSDGEGDS